MDPSASREALSSNSDEQIATEEEIYGEKDDLRSRLHCAHGAHTAEGLSEKQARRQ